MSEVTMAMPLAFTLMLAGLCLLMATLAVHWTSPYWKQYRQYKRLVQTCGYLPEPPKPRAVRLIRFISRLITGVQVGRVKVKSPENFPRSGPAIIALNHPHYADGFVICQVLPRPARYMGAEWVFRLPLGIGPLLSRCGGFCVDTSPGKGGPAFEAAVKVLTTGQQLVICPEGQTSLDGSMVPFKKGAIRIARAAAQKLGTAVPIIPVRLVYGRYPGAWITKWGHAGYVFLLLNAWYYRRGVTVIVGKPVDPAVLSADDHQAAQQLKEIVANLR